MTAAGYHALMREASRAIVCGALSDANGCVAAAALALGLQRTYLYRLMRTLSIPLPRCRVHATSRRLSHGSH